MALTYLFIYAVGYRGLAHTAAETVKAPEDRVTAAVRSAPEVQPFFAQFRYPLITDRAEGDGYVVTQIASGGW